MSRDCEISHRLIAIQGTVFRVATDLARGGVPLKVISADSNIPYETLRTYTAGTIMPITALYKLCGVIPDELLSLLLPGNRMIINAPDEIDHDTLAARCLDYASEHARARHPDGPGGVEVVPAERERLSAKSAHLSTEPGGETHVH